MIPNKSKDTYAYIYVDQIINMEKSERHHYKKTTYTHVCVCVCVS